MILNAEDIAGIRSKSRLRTHTLDLGQQQLKIDLKAGFTRNDGVHCNAPLECPCWCAEKVRSVPESSGRSEHSLEIIASGSLVRRSRSASQI